MSLSDKYPYDPQNPRADLVLPPESPALSTFTSLTWKLVCVWAFFVIVQIVFLPAMCWLDEISFQVRELSAGLFCGFTGAQAGLLILAAVLGPGSVALRQACVIVLGLTWVGAWLLGYCIAEWHDVNTIMLPDAEQLTVILVLPFLLFVGQTPLWTFRAFFRWRVEHCEANKVGDKPAQVSLLGFFVATALVASSLGLVRLGLRLADSPSEEWWLATGIASAVIAVLSLLTLPPAVWCILRWRNEWLGTLAYVGLFAGINLTMYLVAIVVGGGAPVADDFIAFGLLYSGFIVGLIVPLLIVRSGGYRLYWEKQTAN